MGDVTPIKPPMATAQETAKVLLENMKSTDIALVGLVIGEDGDITVTASPMKTERMHYLGGILQNFAMMNPT